MVMLGGAGRRRAVIETVELELRHFGEINAAFAHEEGEGDLTLAYWQNAHRNYFTREGQFAEDMLLWCERFKVIEILKDEADA
jgi:uncharacterized protein YhfF